FLVEALRLETAHHVHVLGHEAHVRKYGHAAFDHETGGGRQGGRALDLDRLYTTAGHHGRGIAKREFGGFLVAAEGHVHDDTCTACGLDHGSGMGGHHFGRDRERVGHAVADHCGGVPHEDHVEVLVDQAGNGRNVSGQGNDLLLPFISRQFGHADASGFCVYTHFFLLSGDLPLASNTGGVIARGCKGSAPAARCLPGRSNYMKIFSPLYARAMQWSRHPKAPWYLAILSFFESVFFPVPPDVMLAPMCLANPRRAWWLALLTTLASVVGGFFGYLIGYFAIDAVMPWLKESAYWPAYSTATQWFADYGFWAIFIAGFSPIPYKVFTIAAG